MTGNGDLDDALPHDLEQALRDSREAVTSELDSKLNIGQGLAAIIRDSHAAGPQWVKAARELADGIRTGRYSPGERLPTIADMAAAACVHPRVMTRALLRLRELGYVDYRSGYGYYVSEEPPGDRSGYGFHVSEELPGVG